MLELDTYGSIPMSNMKDVATAIYVLVDDLYKSQIPSEVQHRLHKEKAVLSDSEIITISIEEWKSKCKHLPDKKPSDRVRISP